MIWLMRMKRWVQHPPSKGRIYLVLGVGAFCLCIALIEYFVGWPEALTLDNQPRRLPTLNK